MPLPRLPLLPALLLLSACASRTSALRVEAFPSAPASAGAPDVYGTPHPLTFEGAAPDGRWVLACQAREDTNGDGRIETTRDEKGAFTGDTLRQYLFLEPGPGVVIDAVLASSPPSRRYLVLRREGSLRLLDTWERQETVLVADVTRGAGAQNPTFSEDGRRLLYQRPEGGEVALVLRDMEAGTERVLDVGPGVLVNAALDASGQWVVLDKVEQDTDGNGRLSQSLWEPGLTYEPCRGLVQGSGEEKVPGDLSVRSYLRVEDGTRHQGSDILGPLRAGLLRRAPDGTLVVEDVRGQRAMWVPASCEGQLVFEDWQRNQLLMACKLDRFARQLQLHGPGVHQALGTKVVLNQQLPMPSLLPRRLLTFEVIDPERFQERSVVVDLEKRTLQPMDYSLVAERGTWALLRERPPAGGAEDFRGQLLLWQVDTNEQTVVGEAGPSSELQRGDHYLYMGWLMNLREGRVLGRMDEEPLAIDTQVRVLRASQMPEQPETQTARGPLRWEPALKAEASGEP